MGKYGLGILRIRSFLRSDYCLLHNTLQTKQINLKSGINIMNNVTLLLQVLNTGEHMSEQPVEVFYEKMCSEKFRNIPKKKYVVETLFYNVAGIQACNFIKKRLKHRCFPVNIAKFSRTPILKSILEQLLLIGKIF